MTHAAAADAASGWVWFRVAMLPGFIGALLCAISGILSRLR